jgi:hypothetical protein
VDNLWGLIRGTLFFEDLDMQSDKTRSALKYLRIAVTALSVTACALFVALWVRSYRTVDMLYLHIPGAGPFKIESLEGRLALVRGHHTGWAVGSHPLAQWQRRVELVRDFDAARNLGGITIPTPIVSLPHWCLAIFAAVILALPWIKWSRQFSLAMLLIATTLIADGLGAIAMSR